MAFVIRFQGDSQIEWGLTPFESQPGIRHPLISAFVGTTMPTTSMLTSLPFLPITNNPTKQLKVSVVN
jgi:hypothetical protein